jgi:hypothetical protein
LLVAEAAIFLFCHLAKNKVTGYNPNGAKIAAAKKAAKSAASSLDFDDVDTSIKLLMQAIDLLTNPAAKA